LDDDGRPETLRLCFATPKRWMEDGKTIRLQKAPTTFGPVSVVVRSELKKGRCTADVDLPSRNKPEKVLFRARIPDGWHIDSASCNDKSVKVDDKGTVDLTSFNGQARLQFFVRESRLR
jgi:hypothetical protein